MGSPTSTLRPAARQKPASAASQHNAMSVHPAVIDFSSMTMLFVEHLLQRKRRQRETTGRRTTLMTLIEPSRSGALNFLQRSMLKENHWFSSSSRILRASCHTPSKSTCERIRRSVERLAYDPGGKPSSPPTTQLSLLILFSVHTERMMDSLSNSPSH